MLNAYIPDRNVRMIVLASVTVLLLYVVRAFLQFKQQEDKKAHFRCWPSADLRKKVFRNFIQFGLTNARPCSKLILFE